ncbi:MAG: di-trans,poly-cis-decaprenylcistransferase [Bryobacterales bacterium]|nr:di-trans,poly-cis-decaprenylcistransferase [Bryobacterales bacterium]
MTQSSFLLYIPQHIAIIMDGNGRWAEARGKPRLAGHRAGMEAVQRTVRAAAAIGVRSLTLFAFSSDNWKRPSSEVAGIFALARQFLVREVGECAQSGIEIRVIGRRDRLPSSLLDAIAEAERRTRAGGRLTLRFAIDYSSRDALVAAAAMACGDAGSRESFSYALAMAYGEPGRRLPDVDLLIRTAGEQRLSDFLLWESAYAELYFTSVPWPDFGESDLRAAIADFANRRRTFGAVPENTSRTQGVLHSYVERRSA